MNLIKKLAVLKNGVTKKVDDSSTQTILINDTQTYYDAGYKDSISANGSSQVFRKCLEDVYAKFKERCRKDLEEQKKLRLPYQEERDRQASTLAARETLKSIKEDEIRDTRESIHKINTDISTVRNTPQDFGLTTQKKPRAQFFIGLLILLPITLYLLVFYVSASYSAFFKTFDPTHDVLAAIFDAKAFSKALNDGWLEAVFVSTIPFAFMGLGYLIHMFQKEKRTGKYKIAALFLITFIFDCILAYQIEKKIYEMEKTLISPDFNLQIAFTSVAFWGIIFAGFVVYIIWGLIFDHVMKEYENIDKIKAFIRKLKEEKQYYLEKKKELTTVINQLKEEITEIKEKIKRLNSKIEGFIFPNRKYLHYHAEYVKGWYIAISEAIALPRPQKEELIEKCNKVAAEHLEKHQITNEDSEGVVYNIVNL